jgi:hypothetical protein
MFGVPSFVPTPSPPASSIQNTFPETFSDLGQLLSHLPRYTQTKKLKTMNSTNPTKAVPEGLPRIARRFNAGKGTRRFRVPMGRLIPGNAKSKPETRDQKLETTSPLEIAGVNRSKQG